MKKIITLTLCFIFTSCITYHVSVNKTICINGHHNNPIIQGAELEDNHFTPKNDIKPDIDTTIPLK